jgi:hypothetical protein
LDYTRSPRHYAKAGFRQDFQFSSASCPVQPAECGRPPVADLRVPAAVLVAGSVLVGLAPLVVFAGRLMALKRRSLVAVGALLAEYGRLFDRRWIRRETVDDAGLLGAPEIGPVADTVALSR